MPTDFERVEGPLPPGQGGGIIYSVTLGNGYQVTSPAGFPPDPSFPRIDVRPYPATGPATPAVPPHE